MMGHRARAIAKALKKDKTIKKVPDCIRKPLPDFECYDKALISLTTHRKPTFHRNQGRVIKKEDTEARLFPFLL